MNMICMTISQRNNRRGGFAQHLAIQDPIEPADGENRRRDHPEMQEQRDDRGPWQQQEVHRQKGVIDNDCTQNAFFHHLEPVRAHLLGVDGLDGRRKIRVLVLLRQIGVEHRQRERLIGHRYSGFAARCSTPSP